MLKAGSSADPYPLTRAAGLDLASPEPYRALMRRMNRGEWTSSKPCWPASPE